MNLRLIAVLVFLAFGVGGGSARAEPPTRYDGQKLVRVFLNSPSTMMLMGQLSPDCWSHHAGLGAEAEYRVPADALDALNAAGVPFEVLIDDLQRPIDEERERLAAGFSGRSWFDDFKTLAEIGDYCDGLAAGHPGAVTLHSLGYSLENREIVALRFTGPADPPGKPALLIIATQHAREWIAVSSAMFVADALANDYGSDPAITELLDSFVVYIVPVVNPDGYEYTWTNDRYWRKNKRVVFDKPYGVDNNRNWSFKWGLPGSSSSASSDQYRGTAPFSEPETEALRDFALTIPNLAAAVDLHSYGRLVLSPWGYTSVTPEEHGSFMAVGYAVKDAIFSAVQQPYSVGACNTKLYPISGSAQDWFYGELGVPSWIIELTSGPFVIAPTAIVPTGTATLQAMLALAERLCPADFDRNRFVNGDDFDVFVGWFIAADHKSDYDRNGFVNADDFDAFTEAFVRGCF